MTKYENQPLNPVDYGVERIYVTMNVAYIREEDEKSEEFLID